MLTLADWDKWSYFGAASDDAEQMRMNKFCCMNLTCCVYISLVSSSPIYCIISPDNDCKGFTESPLSSLLRGHFLGISISALACKEWIMTWCVHDAGYQYSIFKCIPYNAFHSPGVLCQSKSVSLPSERLPARRDVLTTVKSLILLWNRLLFFRGYCRSANGMRIGFGKDKDDIFPFLSRHVCAYRG